MIITHAPKAANSVRRVKTDNCGRWMVICDFYRINAIATRNDSFFCENCNNCLNSIGKSKNGKDELQFSQKIKQGIERVILR